MFHPTLRVEIYMALGKTIYLNKTLKHTNNIGLELHPGDVRSVSQNNRIQTPVGNLALCETEIHRTNIEYTNTKTLATHKSYSER